MAKVTYTPECKTIKVEKDGRTFVCKYDVLSAESTRLFERVFESVIARMPVDENNEGYADRSIIATSSMIAFNGNRETLTICYDEPLTFAVEYQQEGPVMVEISIFSDLILVDTHVKVGNVDVVFFAKTKEDCILAADTNESANRFRVVGA